MPAVPSPNDNTPKPTAISASTLQTLHEIEAGFTLNDAKLHEIFKQFVADFDKGFANYGESMAMVPTFVTGVPTGKETGLAGAHRVSALLCLALIPGLYIYRTFLALDLGGTNLWGPIVSCAYSSSTDAGLFLDASARSYSMESTSLRCASRNTKSPTCSRRGKPGSYLVCFPPMPWQRLCFCSHIPHRLHCRQRRCISHSDRKSTGRGRGPPPWLYVFLPG